MTATQAPVLSRLFAWFWSTVNSGLASGVGPPPQDPPGQRLKPLGSAAARRQLSREYRTGFGWQSLLLGTVVLAVCIVALVPTGIVDRIIHGPPQSLPAKPDVLVVSSRPLDRAAAMATVAPRGYAVLPEETVEAGLESLRREPNRIGIVVVDGDMAAALRVIHEVNTVCPNAHLIVLRGPRDLGKVSSLLLDVM